jgi:uncharacterized protein YciI
MTATAQDVAALLAPMIKKSLWVVLTTSHAPSAEMEPHAPEHLRYMNGLEDAGVLRGSGPFIVPGSVVGNGMTIFDVPDEAEVHRLMASEPLTKLGLRTYTVHKWELREGRSSINLLLSQSKVVLG